MHDKTVKILDLSTEDDEVAFFESGTVLLKWINPHRVVPTELHIQDIDTEERFDQEILFSLILL